VKGARIKIGTMVFDRFFRLCGDAISLHFNAITSAIGRKFNIKRIRADVPRLERSVPPRLDPGLGRMIKADIKTRADMITMVSKNSGS
jgi:hypothetical protein